MNATSILATLACGLLTFPVLAHGGQYRGPGDTVPPGAGGRGGRSGGGGGPTTPGPTGPSGPTSPTPGRTGGNSGGPGGGPGGGGPVTGGRGYTITEDFGTWQYWWEYNKDAYLDLKRHVFAGGTTTGLDDLVVGRGVDMVRSETLRPSETDLRSKVLPALIAGLESPSSNRDLVSSSMIALAKIGRDRSMLPRLEKRLADTVQEIREVAALSMGISAMPEALDTLIDLATNTARGRSLSKQTKAVDTRTRAFACYGCGLIAHDTKDIAIKQRVFETMKSLLDNPNVDRSDIMIAALQAIRLLRIEPVDQDRVACELHAGVSAYLRAFVDRKDSDATAVVRAHAFTALARITGSASDPTIRRRFVEALEDDKVALWIRQSAALGLGQITSEDDQDTCDVLRRAIKVNKDQQTKRFCAIALGQIGGAKNRDVLRRELLTSKSSMKPWVALGLAILCDATRKRGDIDSIGRSISADLQRELREAKDPAVASGLAIALGILRERDADHALLKGLVHFKNDSAAAGYFAIALGMIDGQSAREDIRALLEKSVRDDSLFARCSIALGLLGDKTIASNLIARLLDDENTVAVASSVSQALGFIGDRNSLDGLVTIVKDPARKNIPRAFAAVALGLIGAKEDLPWNSKIARDINYRANVDTLTNGSTGILDIL
ncbi:MAG: hypothetical protein KDC95_07980 [Planctomycetes bacterium]|nr:hypothetical protein [Planctomycetota bacterium]